MNTDDHLMSQSDASWLSPGELFQQKSVVTVCAPMVRYSKLSFRKLVRKYNCDLTFTPMIVSNSFVISKQARDSELTTCQGDRPLIVQFAASNGKDLADAAELVEPFSDGIDLNCGCPQRWALQEGYGACLINKPEILRDMVLQVKNRGLRQNFSTSIKIRIHKDIRRTVDLCQQMEHAGIDWLSVHGRTVTQRAEPVNLEAIKCIKESVQIPVVANGDIKNSEDVEMVSQATGVNGVMSARGILQNPAMYAGYDETPIQCIKDWVNIAMSHGTSFTCFHNHLIYMLDRITTKAEKRIFNTLTSTAAVIDYLQERYEIDELS